jgi:phosphoserine phosphatase
LTPDIRAPRFKSLVLDVDSTLCAIEGIDWLANRRSASLREFVARTTDRAMRGEIALSEIYGKRLEMVQPSRDDIADLACAYLDRLEPGAKEVIAQLRDARLRVVLVTGGFREAVLPLAAELGLAPEDVNAVSLRFNDDGSYADFDTDSPLTQNGGKVKVVREMRLETPVIAVGDGATDLELRTASPPVVDVFVAYAGIVERPPVIRAADYVIRSFAELPELVLG